MNRRIRLLILLTAALAVTTVVLLFRMPPGTSVPAMFWSQCASAYHEAASAPPYGAEIEQLLRDDLDEEARRLIGIGKGEAKDSTTYYQYEVLEAKLHFGNMQADSFLACHRRLHAYLGRQQGTKAKAATRALSIDDELQQGVYATKMANRIADGLTHYHRALQLSEQWGAGSGTKLVILTNIADANKLLGRYDQSVRYYQRALNLGDSVGMSDDMRINIDIGIASAYTAMGSYEKSQQWWEKAERELPKMSQTDRFFYYNNRGNDLFMQGRYAESLEYFLTVDSVTARQADHLWEHMFGRVNLSDVYIKLHQPEKAIALMEQTQQYFAEQQVPLVLYYLDTQRIELAMQDGRLSDAQRLAQQSGMPEWVIPEQKLLRQKVLLELHEKTGNWHDYALTLKAYEQLHDSIASDKQQMQFSEALMHYEHERQMLLKQRQIEEMNLSFRWAVALLVAAAVIIALLVVIGIIRQRERRLREQTMLSRITSLRMETVRNRITPHFIGNALTAEMMAQMDGKPIDLDPLVQLLHRGIEMTGTETTTLEDELEFISYYCSIESKSVGPDFVYQTDIAPDVDPSRVMLPAMTVQILVENALKHGLKNKVMQTGKQRRVVVSARRQGEGTRVEVTDNGVGLPADRHTNDRTGLRVVKQTLTLLNEQQTMRLKHAAREGQLMDFSLENCQHPDGDSGCRATLYLPRDFAYALVEGEAFSAGNEATRTDR